MGLPLTSVVQKMHSQRDENISPGGRNIMGNIRENGYVNTSESNAAIRPGDAEENDNLASNAETNIHAPESNIDSLNSVPMNDMQDAPRGHSYTQRPGHYINPSVIEYFDIEERRQRILRHLYQSGYLDDHFPGETAYVAYQSAYSNYHPPGESSYAATQGLMNYASQQNPVASSQASHPNVCLSCCPPWALHPACSSGVTCGGNTWNATNGAAEPPSLDGDVVKTAMGAAERALSSIKMETPTNLNANEENVEREDNKEETYPSSGSETDLAALLNAWYSIGCYTTKYIAEQSINKKKQQ